MMTIMLYGSLGKQFGKVHRYEVRSAVEAIRALSATIKGFKEVFIEGQYKILRGGRERLDFESACYPQSERESIRIVPVVAGSGDVGKIVLGAALIMLAPATGGMSLSAAFSAGAWGAVAGNIMINFGVSLILSGVASMLFSPTQTGGSQQSVEAVSNRPSYAFDGAVNTAAQGNPVPVCYGKLIVGSQIISAGLTVEQI